MLDNGQLNVFLNILTVLLGGGALGIILKYRLGTKKLTLDSEEAIRDHYAKEVSRLATKLDEETKAFRATIEGLETHYRTMLTASDQRHEECQKDRVVLRSEINKMHDEIRGLKRKMLQNSTDAALLLNDEIEAPHAKAAAPRVRRILKERDDAERKKGE